METMKGIENIGFIGMGNMACAMVKGLVKSEWGRSKKVFAYAPNQEKLKRNAEKIGFMAYDDCRRLVEDSQAIILAVNPSQISEVAEAVKDVIHESQIIMSVASGVTLATYEALFGSDKRIVRIMPNTLISSRNGYSAVAYNGNVQEEDKKQVEELLLQLGQVMELKEEDFDPFTAYCCTGPLWLYKVMEALIDAGVYVGFSRKMSRDMVIKNMLGVAMVMEQTDTSPTVKVEEMTSPAGNTIEGLKVLEEEGGIARPMMASIIATVKKCKGEL
ncbi:MAG: pyrroline-5-carboxylate reductase [Firmicutes bacterium]|nr:pyrroline-5-carboxylate reductase [Bacillota bacterium]